MTRVTSFVVIDQIIFNETILVRVYLWKLFNQVTIIGGLNRSVIVRGAYLLCVTSVLTALLISSAVL